jgi:hypothetical protein
MSHARLSRVLDILDLSSATGMWGRPAPLHKFFCSENLAHRKRPGTALSIRSVFWYYTNMAKSISVLPKKRGRPATGRDPVTAIRLSSELRAAIDAWARKQDEKPSRSEAIRALIKAGLARTKHSRAR